MVDMTGAEGVIMIEGEQEIVRSFNMCTSSVGGITLLEVAIYLLIIAGMAMITVVGTIEMAQEAEVGMAMKGLMVAT